MDDVSPIYVVDDDPAICTAIRRLLAPLGRPVRSFASAEQFLAAVDGSARGCLLLDVSLPGMSGLELRQQLAAQGSALTVILVTAHHDVPAVKSEAAVVVPKPFQREQLLAAIRQVSESATQTPTPSPIPAATTTAKTPAA